MKTKTKKKQRPDTIARPHPVCVKLAREMLAKFAHLPAFDASKVKLNLSVPNMDLTQYDWIIVNTSAGKDSMTMLRQIVALAERQGVKHRVICVHCDLKAMEWYGTKQLARAHATYYGVKFVVVTRPQGDLLVDIFDRGMFPGRGTRFCTSHHKRGQVLKLFTFLARKSRIENYVKRARILNVMGHRSVESCEREQLLPFNPEWKMGQVSNSRRQVDYWYPIHHWSLEEVWSNIRLAGIPWHFAYDLGMTRLSCAFCVFGTRDGWLIAGHYNPDLLKAYIEVEKEIGHSFQHRFSLTVVQERLDRGELPKSSGDWKM